MAKLLWKVARWLAGLGLLIIGARNVPEPSSTLEQRWKDMIPWAWLDANWIALACFVTAAILLLYSPLSWWIERRVTKDVRLRIRANPTPGTFAETDAYEVLHYLLRESVWGWRQYAHFNHWETVQGLHLREFRRAALSNEIVVTGVSAQERKTVVIERRLWDQIRIDPKTIDSPNAVAALDFGWHRIGVPPGFTQLAVGSADVKRVWPRAPVLLRFSCRAWVWLKRLWYGTALYGFIDKRRQRRKKDQERELD